MAGVEEKKATREAKDVVIRETEIATMSATKTDTEMERGVLATNNYSDPAQLHKVI